MFVPRSVHLHKARSRECLNRGFSESIWGVHIILWTFGFGPSCRLLCLLASRMKLRPSLELRDRRQSLALTSFGTARTGVADSLAKSKASESTLNAAVPACSKGAEVYSISYAIRCARTDLKIRLCALDISKDMLEFAEAGVHSLRSHDGSGAPGPGFLPLGRSSPGKTSAQ